MNEDSAGHRFEEFEMLGGEHLRLTYIPHAEWAAGATVRIQKRMASGQLANGPEVPERLVSLLAKGLVDLLVGLPGVGTTNPDRRPKT